MGSRWTTQKRLLAEDGLTITRALEIAKGMEAAAANAKDLKVAAGNKPILQEEIDLFVIAGDGPCHLGRSWMKHILLDLETIGAVSSEAIREGQC